MVNFLLHEYLIYYFNNEEHRKNESIKRMLDYCKENKSLYYDKKKLSLLTKRNKNELILISDIEFYRLIRNKLYKKLLLRFVKKNNIMLIDDTTMRDNYHKNVCNSFLLDQEYVIFYKYLKLKITIHIDFYFNKKIIKNMTNLIIDLHESNRTNYNCCNIEKNNLVSDYLPSSIKILRTNSLYKIKKNLPNKIVLIVSTMFRQVSNIKTRAVTLFLHSRYVYTICYNDIISDLRCNIENDYKCNIEGEFNDVIIKEDYNDFCYNEYSFINNIKELFKNIFEKHNEIKTIPLDIDFEIEKYKKNIILVERRRDLYTNYND